MHKDVVEEPKGQPGTNAAILPLFLYEMEERTKIK